MRHWQLSKLNFSKTSTNANFKKPFMVAGLAVLLTSSYLFFNNQSYETGIAQTKTFRLPDNLKFY
jgi:hypothetical protein